MSSGGGTQTTSYKPPAEVMAAYKDLIARGQGMLGGQAPQYTPGMAAQYGQYNAGLVAPMTPDQIQAMRSIANTQGYTDPFINASANMASSSGSPLDLMRFSGQQVQQYMSPYLNNVVRSAVGNINETNAQQQQQVLGNAIARGAFGGDRSGVAQSELARQQGLAGNATIANLLNAGYGQALGQFNVQQAKDLEAQALSRQYGIQGAQALANIGALGQKSALEQAQAQFGAGLAGQQQQQANLSTAYQQYLNQFQYPYNQLGWYGGLISGAGSGMGGTTTANMPGASPLSSVIGIGSMLGAMGGSGGIMGLFGSDERIKENIEPVGETYDGQQIYRYNYKGEPRTQIGLIAQEVEQRHPKAVGDMGNGILGVNYRDATEKAAQRGHFYDGGVVGHYADGGQTWVNTKGDGKTDTKTTTPSTWGYVAPNPQGDLTTPALNTYQNMAMSGQGSYGDLQNAYANYLQSFQMPAGSALPMVGFAPKTDTGNGNNNNNKDDKHNRNRGDRYQKTALEMMSGHADGGVVGHYQGGGLVPQIHMDYGLQSKQDIKNAAEHAVGSGVMTDPATEALGSEDVMGVRAHGGRIHKAIAGEVSGDQAADAAGVVPPEPVKDDFDDIIQKTLPRIKMSESGGKNIANQAGTSSAFGPYQFTHGTWKDLVTKNPDLKLTEMDRLKAEAQEKVAPIYARNIATQFKRENIPVTPETLKMGWFLGPQGATNFMRKMAQDPDAPAYELDPRAAKANQEIFFNKDGTPKSVNQVFGQLSSSLGKEEKPTPQTLLDKILGRTPQPAGAQIASNMAPAATGRQAAGGFFPGLDDPGRLALFKFGATMAGTPGPFGYGLAAAANAYADSMIASKRLETESGKRAAETERERATAGLTRAQERQQRFMKTPTGQFILSGPGDEAIDIERFNPSQVSQSGTYGGQPSGTPGVPSTPPVVTESGAPVTPTAPTAPGTQAGQPSTFGSVYDGGKSFEDKAKAYDAAVNAARNNDMAYGTYGEKMQEQFREAQTAYQAKQGAASEAAQDIGSMVKAVSSLSDTGWLRPGADADFRFTVGKYADTYLGGMGADSGLSPELSANEILGKLSTFQANAQAKGNPAARWQETLKESMPNVDQTPTTTRSLVSSLIVNNRRDQDLGEFATRYGKDTYYVGTDLNNVFNRLYSQQEYANDKTAIETLLGMGKEVNDKGVRINPITDLVDGKITPKQFDAFVYNYMKQRNPKYAVTNLSRYFVSGQ